jgi:hypothetical protein
LLASSAAIEQLSYQLTHKHMTTRTISADYNFRRGYQAYDDVDRPMTRFQRRTLTDLIYGCISHPDEVERRVAQIEDYDYFDAAEAIEQYQYAQYK